MPDPLTPWDLFVLRHTHPGNIVVHAFSSLLFFGTPPLALALWSPWPLVGFAVSGWVGAAGHKIFKDGGVSLREATSRPEVPYYVLVMFWRILRGEYRANIEAARKKVEAGA